MIWTWLKQAILFLLKLVVPPPLPPPQVPKIDVNAPCPACGNCSGRIQVIKLKNNEMMVRHDCKLCNAAWHERPILNARDVIHVTAAK